MTAKKLVKNDNPNIFRDILRIVVSHPETQEFMLAAMDSVLDNLN